MSRISGKLSSLQLTTWILVALVLWFTWGVLLTVSETLVEGFYQMNSTLVRHWLADPNFDHLLLKLWFVGLCLIMVVMGINLIFCSITKMLRFIRVRFTGPRLFMLILHVVFGLVALGHFGGFMLGSKYDTISLREGERFCVDDGFEVKVVNVHFIDNHEVLKRSHRELTREEFHYRKNFAEVLLSRNGRELKRAKIYILNPLRHEDIQITLRRFSPLRATGNGEQRNAKPGVMLALSRNPVLASFLTLYPMMILGILVYLLMTWHLPSQSKVEKRSSFSKSGSGLKGRSVLELFRKLPRKVGKEGKEHVKFQKKCVCLVLGVIFLLFLFPCELRAEETSEYEGTKRANVFQLGEIVVTGKAETITEVSTVEIVNRERLDLITVDNVSDAINSVPGVALSVGSKNERNIIVRGFNQRYVPVFYDGIPIYIPYDGFVDTGKLPTENVSQITVTKGISSVLYGFNAMGGVVNIVSKKPEKRFEADYKLEYTEDNAIDANLNLGSMHRDFYVAAFVGSLDSDGFPLSDEFEPTTNEDGDTRDNSDIDRLSLSLKAGYTPAPGHEYAFGITKVDSEYGLPPHATDARPRYWRFTDWEKLTYYLIGDSKITDTFKTNIRLYRDEYYNVLDSYDDNTYSSQTIRYAFHSTYDDYSNGGSLILRSDYIPSQTLSLSFHYREDVHKEQDDSEELWERYEEEMFSYGLEDDIKLSGDLAIVLGGSYDVQKPTYANGGTLRDDEDAFNPQAGIRLTILNDADLHFSVGRKTRFPTLFELYSGQFGRNIPNPNLGEEKAINYELGIQKPLPLDSWGSITLFRSDLKDKIAKKTVTANTTQYQNIGEARHTGLEFAVASGIIPKNDFELHYTYIDAENRSPDRTSDHLEEIPKHKLYITDLYQVSDLVNLFAKLEWNSKRYFEDSNTNEWRTTSGFLTVDIKAILKIRDYLNIGFGAKNLLDEDYEFTDGFPMEGRNFFALIRGTY